MNAVLHGRRKFRKEILKFRKPPLVFFLRINIRVIVKNCYVKIRRKIFDDVGRTRRTAGVKEKLRFFMRRFYLFKDFFKLFLIIYFLHIPF